MQPAYGSGREAMGAPSLTSVSEYRTWSGLHPAVSLPLRFGFESAYYVLNQITATLPSLYSMDTAPARPPVRPADIGPYGLASIREASALQEAGGLAGPVLYNYSIRDDSYPSVVADTGASPQHTLTEGIPEDPSDEDSESGTSDNVQGAGPRGGSGGRDDSDDDAGAGAGSCQWITTRIVAWYSRARPLR
jgi:hypothetical protein